MDVDCKATDQSNSLMAFKPKQVGVDMEAHSFQPGDPSFPCSFMFLVGVLRDPVASFNICSIYIIYEVISCSRGISQSSLEYIVWICGEGRG